MKVTLGLLVAFLVGFFCRFFGLEAPAPPKLVGALMVLAITLGYISADRLKRQPSEIASTCVSNGEDEVDSQSCTVEE